VLKRAFLAVVPPPEVIEAIDDLLERPKSSRFAWTRPDQWHITMQFYGRIGDVDSLTEGLRAASAAWDPIAVRIEGGGAFPNPKNARVFWLGVGGVDGLRDLHATVAAATRSFIDRRDRIDLIPHLTLARVKRATDLTADVDGLSGVVVGPPWRCTELILFESETHRDGAVYVEQSRFPLGGLMA
jgi:2'-5' RNA ligase